MATDTAIPAAIAPARRFDTGRVVVWGGYALVLALAPLVFTSSLRPVDPVADRHRHRRLPFLQHAARAGRDAQLRARRLQRPGLVRGDPRAALDRQRHPADSGQPDPARRRLRRPGLRGPARLRDDQEVGDDLRDDHAGHRRAGLRDVADDSRSSSAAKAASPRTGSSASPSWASTTGRSSRSTTCSPCTRWSARRRCSPSRARRSAACSTRCATTPSGSSSSATAPSGCATCRSSSPVSSPASPAACTPSISRSPRPKWWARCAPAATCCSPSSAARPSSSGRSSARC